MATATLPIIPAAASGSKSSSILDIVKSGQGLLDIFAGKSTSGTQSQTTQTNLSTEAVQELLAQILGGTQGLAAVSSGQKVSGLYNSSVNTLLTNDLLKRAAGEVAVRNAPTTVTGRVTNMQAPQMDIGKSLMGLGATVLGKKALSASGIDKGIDNILSDIFGKKTSPFDLEDASLGIAAEGFSGGGSDIASAAFSSGADVFGSGANISSGVFGSLGDTGFSLGVDAIESAGLFGSLGDSASFIDGAEGFADAAGVADFAGGVPIIGPAIRLFSGDAGGAAGSAAGGAIGSAILPGIGTAIGSVLGGAVGGGSVICTELHRQGIMSTTLYRIDIEFAHKYLSPTMLRGYRVWGIPFVRAMRKSTWLTRIAAFCAIKRAESLIGKSIFGSLFRKIFEPLCYLIGLFVTEQDYSILYNTESA